MSSKPHPCFVCGSMFIGEGVICGYCLKRTQSIERKGFVELIIWLYNHTIGILSELIGEQTY